LSGLKVQTWRYKQKKKKPKAYENAWRKLKCGDGILIPGGFGNRGTEGKVMAAEYARKNQVPFLGICLGMQIMVIEYARNICGFRDANSSEFDVNTKHPVVMFMPEVNQAKMGGTMRVGGRVCKITKPSLAFHLYKSEEITERHRHRYEVCPCYAQQLEEAGLFFSGMDENGVRMEIAELPFSVHPFYFGCQFHPEFLSRPHQPSPPFVGFARAASGQRDWLELAEPIDACFEKLGTPMSSSSINDFHEAGEGHEKSIDFVRRNSNPQA